MGRTRSFETSDVTRAARNVFWAQGYFETAVPDLEQATGLNRSSLYQAFGSKRGLFDAAVDSYLEEVVRPPLAPLHAAVVDPGSLEKYLADVRAAMIEQRTPLAANGCLLMNAAGGAIGHDATLQHIVARYYAELHDAITAGIVARHPGLELARVQALTTSCTALLLAAMSLVKADPTAAAGMLDTAIDAVRAD